MYDAVVIGSGPGGYECARRIAGMGGKVAIVERDALGGTCTNHGCIPTKALHASASFFLSLSKANKLGFSVQASPVDLNSLMQRKDRIVKISSLGVKKILEQSGVEIINAGAGIKDSHCVLASGKALETKNIVIATGAQPRKIPGIEIGEAFLTSTELLKLRELPSSLIIIGAGYVGCEFASIFASLNVKVTVLETMPRILYGEDEDISKELSSLMIRSGIDIFTDSSIVRIEGNKILFKHNNEEKEAFADKALIAIGVDPFFDKSEMNKLGVNYDKGIIVNNKMQTSVENIYAVGDVTNKIKLAHYAYAQAEVAAKNIMGQASVFDETIVPSAIFTIPEIACVGSRTKLKSATAHFAANGKARAMGEADGFVKIYYEDGYLKGFFAIGPHVSDIVSEATLAIKNRIPLEKIKETIHQHPTLSETFLAAVEKALNN